MDGKCIPLVAWEKLSRPMVDGGLGLKDFRSHSDALLSKWFTRALDCQDLEWAQSVVCGESATNKVAEFQDCPPESVFDE